MRYRGRTLNGVRYVSGTNAESVSSSACTASKASINPGSYKQSLTLNKSSY